MLKNISKIICLIWLLCCQFNSAQKYLVNQFNYAQSLYGNEKYFDCITELKRLMLFDTSKVFSYRAQMLAGDCYKKGARFNDAAKYFNLAVQSAGSPQEEYFAMIAGIRNDILRNQPGMALYNLGRLAKDTAFSDLKKEIVYWRGWAFMRKGEWKNANKQFSMYGEDSVLINITKEAYEREYSPVKAKMLSIFLPGTGQMYSGSYISGLLSFALVVTGAVFTVKALISERLFDALIIGTLAQRFYMGSINNSVDYAEKENDMLYNEVFTFLESKFSGIKP